MEIGTEVAENSAISSAEAAPERHLDERTLSIVNGLCASVGINRPYFLARDRSKIPKDLRDLISGSSIRLTDQELTVKSHLADVASSGIDIYKYKIEHFPQELEEFLVLEVPKDIEYHEVKQNSKSFLAKQKAKQKSSRTGTKRSGGSGRRSGGNKYLPNLANIAPASVSAFDAVDDENEREAKRMRGELDDMEEDEDEDEDLGAPPVNLQQVIKQVYDEYSTMLRGTNDQQITMAFFAKINKWNCLEFGLQNYADESDTCSMAAMEKKLKEKSYVNKEAFYSDFWLMLDNIREYYPADHPARAKAQEVLAHFEKRWDEALRSFKYE